MEARDGGGARLVLKYKQTGQSGIQRLSCDLPPAALARLVLFAEGLSLDQSFGLHRAAEFSAEGLTLAFDPARADLGIERQAGYSRQSTRLPAAVFLSEMAPMAELCFAQAEASKHGGDIKRLLGNSPVPDRLQQGLPEDAADQTMHQLREIALLLLVQEAGVRGSALARRLRAKRSQAQAQAIVDNLVQEIAEVFVPARDAQVHRSGS